MTSNRPYLIRAYYEWIVDNNLTPHLVVDATFKGVIVPDEYVKDGQIVLNVSPSACGNLLIGDVDIEFDARFSGVPRHLVVPASAVLAIYARENGAGTMFPREEKHGQTDSADTELDSLKSVLEEGDSDGNDDDPPKPPRGRPTLKVVK
ncbi:ClpXP protease specificity-enhancing factor [Planctobacterium marinum]|uniref:ClpXP protease specificity-enhancing factor n=1 Tax=Planctobacterium marinum TaxID=1631968 RepID=UPI001E3A90DA|nr:ClpXP protease specificity-enhancing factor [Planctobacterium marinum]MCC2604884.1 ClpXP protease specificity-enhancing factor [Planctobacterium marinum]